MAKNKSGRVLVMLESRVQEGVFRYATTKNKKNTPTRLELKKYSPLTRKHETFKEVK